MKSQFARRSQIRVRRKPRGEGYQRRAEILAAARSLFLKEGVDRVTIRAICARVGITSPSLYFHFRNKREIIIAICNETFGHLLERFREIRASELKPLDALRQMMETYVRFALSHPDEYRLLFMSRDLLLLEFSGDFKSDEDAIRAGVLGPLVLRELAEHIGLCIKRGILRQGDPTILSEIVWSSGHGLASLLITHPHFKNRPRDELIAAAIELTFKGLLRQ
jgi:AcrR family transcriptional regulator